MDLLRWDRDPDVHNPLLVVAFEGWNDAGEAASGAAEWLGERLGAQPFADFDPEELFDFTVARPNVRLFEGTTRRIDWPELTLAACTAASSEDVVLLTGPEPHLRWKTFSAACVQAAMRIDARLVVTLGGLLSDVPHTHPVRVAGTAVDPILAERLGMGRSTYEGPTGIVGVLHDSFARAGLASVSLWANVPHYVSQTPSPKAMLALIDRVASLAGASLDTSPLVSASQEYEAQVDAVLAEDEDASAYVRRLEMDAAATIDEGWGEDLPEAGALASEVERFLREQGE